MSSGRAWAVFGVSLTLLAGCAHKAPKVVAVPPPAEAPQVSPSLMAATLPSVPPPDPVVTTHPVKLDTTAPPEVKPEVATTQPHHPAKHHAARPAAEEVKGPSSSGPSPAQTAQASAPSPESTPIGTLTTAPDAANMADRQALSTQIDATENGVNAIKRSLSSDEQKTVILIRQYITRARDRLQVGDLDGATTLSNKAHQLLQELTKT